MGGDVGGHRVTEAVAGAVAVLRTVTDRDWTAVKPAGMEWTVHETAFHICGCLIAYAGNLAGGAQDDYVPFDITLDEGTDNTGLLHVLETGGALLAAAVRTAPREARAFHPYPFRSANREGFAAMGITEVLLHTYDVARGLDLAYEPPAHLPEYVLTRIFPEVQPGPDPWRTLLWATGRGDLPGRARRTEWRWSNNLVLPAERLTLQGVTPASATDLAAGGDGGFDWVEDGPFEGTREAAGMTLKAYEAGVHRPEFGLFVLVRREDGRAIGGMGFHGAPDGDGRAEVGYDLAPSARGRGYATEALRALSDWALARDDVRSLCATIEPDNAPSQRVIARAGFLRASVEEEQAYGEKEPGLRLYVLSDPTPEAT
ncbi:GNAT family N-acetyltransferase [Streptomyces sp. BK205]|uniref:GNAT family N-acetyltransferase n=1 Tax=Streptomyces sp. BK205 TaxID=2512164 RepID=UPI001A9FC6A7|nr:GNAT family N-acetyltransferase [Streptomyces sp. BK205]